MEFKENIQQYPLFTVKTNGRIGISFDPPNQKLQVGGNILADAYTPDYVFEHYFEGQSELNPNYKSYSLEKTKKYIANEGILDTILEETRNWIVGITLARLASQGQLECAWDVERDCMIFWRAKNAEEETD